MPFAIQDFINATQALIWDEPTSKIVKPDDLTQQVAKGASAGRTSFMLSNQNIVSANMPNQSGPILQSTDGGPFVAIGITLTDAINGVITMAVAPLKSLRVIYYFQFLNATDINNVVFNGLRQIGVDPTQSSQYSVVPQQLFQAPCYLAAAEALRNNSASFVKFYNISIAGKSISKGDKFNNIMKLADSFEEKAGMIRQDYYTIQDRGLRPAATTRGAGVARTAPPYAGDFDQPRR